jgi:glycosyltransferase involved in cell wall biosynthesis
MILHERYEYKDLETLFDKTDVLVAPSIWCETFGFVVLEALSYGVPVIISATVGAKDILADGAGIVLDKICVENLFAAFQSLNTQQLKVMNKAIIDKQTIMVLPEMSKRIEKECYGSYEKESNV